MVLPLPRGEGRGEGERRIQLLCYGQVFGSFFATVPCSAWSRVAATYSWFTEVFGSLGLNFPSMTPVNNFPITFRCFLHQSSFTNSPSQRFFKLLSYKRRHRAALAVNLQKQR